MPIQVLRSARSGELIPHLPRDLVTLTDFAGPSNLNRFNRLRAVTIAS
ncbi:hypothetical protein [Vreelandella azerica]|nr:hypothetical protein [Halomonas azerica]